MSQSWELSFHSFLETLILQVLEIRPTAPHHLPIGARVCILWSSALAQLFPGTITTPDEPLPEGHVLVELDDGDSRLVEMSKIRMLPTNYSRVGESLYSSAIY